MRSQGQPGISSSINYTRIAPQDTVYGTQLGKLDIQYILYTLVMDRLHRDIWLRFQTGKKRNNIFPIIAQNLHQLSKVYLANTAKIESIQNVYLP
jgi:hypothetical protein